jgi:hypothetical protein
MIAWPQTVSTLEVIRFLAAGWGLIVSLRGRSISRRHRPAPPSADDALTVRERAERQTLHLRLGLYESLQASFVLVHLLLLLNVVVNFFYESAPLEQVNVISSNLAQALIPLVLARASELVSAQIRAALGLRTVAGPAGEPEPPTRRRGR